MSFEDSSESFDLLYYLLSKSRSLTTFTLPWQPNITSLEKYSNLENRNKMQHFTLLQIPAIIPPNEVATFINKHFTDNGFMCLSFLIETTESYYEKIKSLISSKNFHLQIEQEKDGRSFLRS